MEGEPVVIPPPALNAEVAPSASTKVTEEKPETGDEPLVDPEVSRKMANWVFKYML